MKNAVSENRGLFLKFLETAVHAINSVFAAVVLAAAFAVVLNLFFPGILFGWHRTAGLPSAQNKACTLFSAAQTYVCDYYEQNGGTVVQSVTPADLYNAGLLTRMPDTKNISIVLEENKPAVKYVIYDGYKYPQDK